MINFSPIIKIKYLFFIFRNKKNNINDFINLISKNYKSYKLFSNSSWSLIFICLLRKYLFNKNKITVYFPNYYCDEALNQIRSSNFVELLFYNVDFDLRPNLDDLNNKFKIKPPDLLVISHYFDFRNDLSVFKNLSILNNNWLIEDATHCLIEDNLVGRNSDFVLFSPYKWLGTNNGAILYAKENGPSKFKTNKKIIEIFNSNIFDKDILKIYYEYRSNKKNLYEIYFFIKIILNNLGFRKKKYLFSNTNVQLNSISYPFIGMISKFLLINISNDLSLIKNARNINYQIIKKLINQKFNSNQKINVKDNYHVPFFIELDSENKDLDALQKNLSNYEITSFYWPNIPRELKYDTKVYDNLNLIKSKKLYVPIHQSISTFKIKKLFNLHYKNSKNIKIIKTSLESTYEKDTHNTYYNMLQSYSYGFARNRTNYIRVNRYNILVDEEIVGQYLSYEKNFFLLKIIKINKGPFFIKNISDNLKFIIINSILKKYSIYKLNILIFSSPIKISYENIEFLIKSKFNKIIFNNYSTIILDLSKNIDDLNNNLSQKWRNLLNKSHKLNKKIFIKEFIDNSSLYLDRYFNAQTKNYSKINQNLLNKLSNNLKVFESYNNKALISFIIIYTYNKNATYLIGWNNDLGYKNNSHYSLIWKAINYLKNNNYKYFDLGGIDIINNPNVSHFKLGISKDVSEFYGDIIKY